MFYNTGVAGVAVGEREEEEVVATRYPGGYYEVMTLTPRTEHLLTVVASFWDDNGYGPSHRDLAAFLDVSTGTIRKHLMRLVAAGYITRHPQVPRGVAVTEDGLRHLRDRSNQ